MPSDVNAALSRSITEFLAGSFVHRVSLKVEGIICISLDEQDNHTVLKFNKTFPAACGLSARQEDYYGEDASMSSICDLEEDSLQDFQTVTTQHHHLTNSLDSSLPNGLGPSNHHNFPTGSREVSASPSFYIPVEPSSPSLGLVIKQEPILVDDDAAFDNSMPTIEPLAPDAVTSQVHDFPPASTIVSTGSTSETIKVSSVAEVPHAFQQPVVATTPISSPQKRVPSTPASAVQKKVPSASTMPQVRVMSSGSDVADTPDEHVRVRLLNNFNRCLSDHSTSCRACLKELGSMVQLAEHQELHVVQCIFCSRLSKTNQAFPKHVRAQHLVGNNAVCPFCCCLFSTLKEALFHVAEGHKVQDIQSTFELKLALRGGRLISSSSGANCFYCKKHFSSIPLLLQHQKNHNVAVGNKQALDQASFVGDQSKSQFECAECKQVFLGKADLDNHCESSRHVMAAVMQENREETNLAMSARHVSELEATGAPVSHPEPRSASLVNTVVSATVSNKESSSNAFSAPSISASGPSTPVTSSNKQPGKATGGLRSQVCSCGYSSSVNASNVKRHMGICKFGRRVKSKNGYLLCPYCNFRCLQWSALMIHSKYCKNMPGNLTPKVLPHRLLGNARPTLPAKVVTASTETGSTASTSPQEEDSLGGLDLSTEVKQTSGPGRSNICDCGYTCKDSWNLRKHRSVCRFKTKIKCAGGYLCCPDCGFRSLNWKGLIRHSTFCKVTAGGAAPESSDLEVATPTENMDNAENIAGAETVTQAPHVTSTEPTEKIDKPVPNTTGFNDATLAERLQKNFEETVELSSLSCRVCKKIFSSQPSLETHQGFHHVQCLICLRLTTKPEYFYSHCYRRHLHGEKFVCPYCRCLFSTFPDICSHLSSLHDTTQVANRLEVAMALKGGRFSMASTGFECVHCRRYLSSSGKLILHQKICKPPKRKAKILDSEKAPQCNSCKRKFFTAEDLERHSRTCVMPLDLSTIPSSSAAKGTADIRNNSEHDTTAQGSLDMSTSLISATSSTAETPDHSSVGSEMAVSAAVSLAHVESAVKTDAVTSTPITSLPAAEHECPRCGFSSLRSAHISRHLKTCTLTKKVVQRDGYLFCPYCKFKATGWVRLMVHANQKCKVRQRAGLAQSSGEAASDPSIPSSSGAQLTKDTASMSELGELEEGEKQVHSENPPSEISAPVSNVPVASTSERVMPVSEGTPRQDASRPTVIPCSVSALSPMKKLTSNSAKIVLENAIKLEPFVAATSATSRETKKIQHFDLQADVPTGQPSTSSNNMVQFTSTHFSPSVAEPFAAPQKLAQEYSAEAPESVDICKEDLDLPERLRINFFRCLQVPTTACSACNEMFPSSYLLANHQRSHVVRCLLCFRLSSHPGQLAPHVSKNHLGGKRYVCPQCLCLSGTLQGALAHLKNNHGFDAIPDTVEVKLAMQGGQIAIPSNGNWLCSVCNKGFPTVGSLLLHEKHHAKVAPYIRRQGSRRYGDDRFYTGDPVACDTCFQTFLGNEDLLAHKPKCIPVTVPGGPTYLGSSLPLSTPEQMAMPSSLSTTAPPDALAESVFGMPNDSYTPSGLPKLYQCDECRKSFARKEHLVRHKKLKHETLSHSASFDAIVNMIPASSSTEKLRSPSTSTLEQASEKARGYQCPFCSFMANIPATLTAHIGQFHKEHTTYPNPDLATTSANAAGHQASSSMTRPQTLPAEHQSTAARTLDTVGFSAMAPEPVDIGLIQTQQEGHYSSGGVFNEPTLADQEFQEDVAESDDDFMIYDLST